MSPLIVSNQKLTKKKLRLHAYLHYFSQSCALNRGYCTGILELELPSSKSFEEHIDRSAPRQLRLGSNKNWKLWDCAWQGRGSNINNK